MSTTVRPPRLIGRPTVVRLRGGPDRREKALWTEGALCRISIAIVKEQAWLMTIRSHKHDLWSEERARRSVEERWESRRMQMLVGGSCRARKATDSTLSEISCHQPNNANSRDSL